jgi:hypothetical protein
MLIASGYSTNEAADDFLLGLAFLDALGHVVLGRLVVGQPYQHDPV